MDVSTQTTSKSLAVESRSIIRAIAILIYAIQTSDEPIRVGLMSAPGIMRLTEDVLYDNTAESRAVLVDYLLYVYSKKTRMDELRGKHLVPMMKQYIEDTF